MKNELWPGPCRTAVRRVIWSAAVSAALLPSSVLQAKTVVFWQPGFPTVASKPVGRAEMARALEGMDPQFADIESLRDPVTLAGADLLVLPYGSAVPVDGWKAITDFLHAGGSLLIVGGQPLRVPVSQSNGKFEQEVPQDTYSRALDFRHSYAVPVSENAHFAWRRGYNLPQTQVRARQFFAVEGRLNGLGYIVDGADQLVAAPVIVADHLYGPMKGSRVVSLDFDPQPGYWQSTDGISLLRQTALYASRGATSLSVEVLFSAVRPDEPPVITVHLRAMHPKHITRAVIKVRLQSEKTDIDSTTFSVPETGDANLTFPFHSALPPGFYAVTAELRTDGHADEFYRNGFWVEDAQALNAGPVLSVKGDFLTRDGVPYFPVGTNYFTTEEDGWDFAGPRNASVWDDDFADMARHGVTFVRTGVWMSNAHFIEAGTGGVNERFLRNLEAYLRCAQRHKIAVNFTFFAFTPKSGGGPESPGVTPPNPYTEHTSVAAEQAYVHSIVKRFKDVPWLSWDLINEPSFSNPQHIFHGNYPNGDASEAALWRKWLRNKYNGDLQALARAWRVPAADLGSFDAIPLPSPADLAPQRYGNPNEVRALDYNLFAQDVFRDWVRSMVALIRATGSAQLIDVGQDEGGVTDRVLNQFYGGAGVSFTTNHTYWQDHALLWDSVAAKRPGIPNITGETGYQPVWQPDGTWRYDELSGVDLLERKWALGFAAGSSGALQWDWAREVDFGMQRSDGSAKVWENRMQMLGAFAEKAGPWATGLQLPQIAIVLPQSFQMSVANSFAVQAQQNAVRALYGYARGAAYAVGEYQPELLGNPRLILLPSPMGLTENAWEAIERRVRDGAVLLITGPFDGDAHLEETNRMAMLGQPLQTVPLAIRINTVQFPFGEERLIFGGNNTTILSRAESESGQNWTERPLGKGKILFSALPLELNENLQAIGDAYRYAMKTAGVAPVYTTAADDPGILICPTEFPSATLYVITSESNRELVDFTDVRSGKRFAGKLASGRASILLIGADGELLASYNWPRQ